MDIDALEQVGFVSRVLEDTERDGRPAKAITATRTFATTVADLWDAVTSAERIARWFLPVSGDLRLGGRYQFEGNAGGEVRACEPPRRFEITWENGDDVSWVTVELTPAGDGSSRLELRHVAHPPEEFWDQYGPGAVGVGWDGAILALGLYVAAGPAFDREATEAWAMSPASAAFYLASSAAWAEAAKAAGVPGDVADGWHERAGAFYTGQG